MRQLFPIGIGLSSGDGHSAERNVDMRPWSVLLSGALAVAAEPALCQPVLDGIACQKRVDAVALAIGAPKTQVVNGSFSIARAKIATISGDCGRSLFVTPEPAPFAQPLSPAYPGLAVRVAALVFALRPIEARQAADACLKAAVSDPPSRTGRAGFARQRWRNSQMRGRVAMNGLNWDCTYNDSNKRAASFEIVKDQ